MKKLFTDRVKIFYLLFMFILFIELAGAIIGLFNTNMAVVDASKSNIFLIILTATALIIPWRIEYKYKIDLPDILEYVVLIMLFIAVVLGFLHDYYVHVTGFDKFTHTLSGVTLSLLAFQTVLFMNETKSFLLKIGNGMVAIFSFAFSMTLLVLWEFYEFTIDVISFHQNGPILSNMQRYQWTDTPAFFPQDYGLFDTMIDLFVGAFGAMIVSIVGYIILRHKTKKNQLLGKE